MEEESRRTNTPGPTEAFKGHRLKVVVEREAQAAAELKDREIS